MTCMTERRTRRRGGPQAWQGSTRGCAMRKARLGRARASRAHNFQLCFLFQRSGASGKQRSTLMSPLIGQPARHLPLLRRRGAGGEAQAGRRSARWCDCAKAGCAVSWCIRHAPTCLLGREEQPPRSAEQPEPPKPKPLTSTAPAIERCERVSSGWALQRGFAMGSRLDAERCWMARATSVLPKAATSSADL
jgi:hypothetical protein